MIHMIESEKINIELPSLDGQEITPPQFPQREHHDLKYILPLNPHDVPVSTSNANLH